MQENQDPSSKWYLTPSVSHVNLNFPRTSVIPPEARIPPPKPPKSHENNTVLLFQDLKFGVDLTQLSSVQSLSHVQLFATP